MPILLPFAFGGLVVTTVGLGMKRALEELGPPPTPEELRVREARAKHRDAVDVLRAVRRRTRERARGHGERQARALLECVEPFHALLARLERWELVRPAEVLSSSAQATLRALPEGFTPPPARASWPLLGAGRPVPSLLAPVVAWLDGGWLEETAPVVVDGAPLYEAVAVERFAHGSPAELLRAFESATAQVRRATAFLDALHTRLEVLDARLGSLHTRASAQLAYLDASSFEEGGPEPRERLRRLGQLMDSLAGVLRTPVLDAQGRLTELPDVPLPVEPFGRFQA